MIVGGYNKKSVKNKLTDFFITTKQCFDTSKLDISKIMGMNNDLEDTLKMVDSIPKDDSSKGGDR